MPKFKDPNQPKQKPRTVYDTVENWTDLDLACQANGKTFPVVMKELVNQYVEANREKIKVSRFKNLLTHLIAKIDIDASTIEKFNEGKLDLSEHINEWVKGLDIDKDEAQEIIGKYLKASADIAKVFSADVPKKKT